MSTLDLDTRMYYKDSQGLYQATTVREAILAGEGKAYEYLKASPAWNNLTSKLADEQQNPISLLAEKIRLADQRVAKAKWWHDEGRYNTEGSPATASISDADERLEAWNEYKSAADQLESYLKQHEEAVSKVQDAIATREVDENIQRAQWEAFNLEATRDSWDGTVKLVRLAATGASLPVYPWPNCENQPSYTANFFSTDTFLPKGEELKYPTGTKLCITYTTPGAPNILSRKAYLNADGKPYQVSPEERSFESIAQFINYDRHMYRANITVTLPDHLTPKQRQVADMESWLQEDGQKYLPLSRKIAMIYQEFGLKSCVVLNRDRVSGNPVCYEGYQNPREIIGEFICDTRSQLEIQDKNEIWRPVAECEGRAYFKNLLVNNLKDHVKDGKLLFRLSWNTAQGRKSATLSL